MFKRFSSIVITVTIVSLVVGYIAATLARPNNLSKRLGSLPSRVTSVVSPSKASDAHEFAGQIKQSTCMRSSCHGTMKTKKTPWHRMHLTISLTNFECQTCHNRKITTGLRSMAGKVNINRAICLKCHRQKFQAFIPQHKRPNWVKLHKVLPVVGKLKPKCFMCHNSEHKELDFCKQCHKRHEHSKRWIFGGHGKKAKQIFNFVATKNTPKKVVEENKSFLCLRCHGKKEWCAWRCHQGVTLPHKIPKWMQFFKDDRKEPQWRKIHFKLGLKIGLEKCKRCHRFRGGNPTLERTPFNKDWEKKEFCQQCHHKLFYKKNPSLNVPWATKKGGMAYVKKQGSVRCWKCHDLDFCVYCHTKNEKPPFMNFKKERKSSNYKPAEVLINEMNKLKLGEPPNYYNYYNNDIPVERLYPEFNSRGFFKRNVSHNRQMTEPDKLTPKELLPPGQTRKNLGE